MKIPQVLKRIRGSLRDSSDTPDLDAQVLLAHVLHTSRTWLAAHPEFPLSPQQLSMLNELIMQRKSGVPLPYLLGEWEFFSMPFYVTPDVLIPRPETELLVEHGRIRLAAMEKPAQVLDIGTGSGCIAAAIAQSNTACSIIAGDCSCPALAVARRNILRHGLHNRVSLVAFDLIPPMERKFDAILMNLPYIPSDDLDSLPVSRYEPRLALDGGDDGMAVFFRLFPHLPRFLESGGFILAEIEFRQGNAALALARRHFPNHTCHIQKDLFGNDRLLIIER